jgi:group I intron endonuclease
MKKKLEISDIPTNSIGVIYKLTNKISGKVYIGQKSSKDFRNQFQEYWGSGVLITRAIKKYGKQNFEKEIIDEASSQKELNEKEVSYIDIHQSLNPKGYNIAEGGHGYSRRGKSKKELRELFDRISKTWANKTPEEKKLFSKHVSEAHIGIYVGNRNIKKIINGKTVFKFVKDPTPYLKEGWEFGGPFKGVPRPQKFIDKMTGRERSKETRAKISKTLTGRPFSEERKLNVSKSLIGKKYPPRTEEHRRKIGNSNRGKKRSKEQIEKNAAVHRGKHHSAEWNKNISKGHTEMKYNKHRKTQ